MLPMFNWCLGEEEREYLGFVSVRDSCDEQGPPLIAHFLNKCLEMIKTSIDPKTQVAINAIMWFACIECARSGDCRRVMSKAFKNVIAGSPITRKRFYETNAQSNVHLFTEYRSQFTYVSFKQSVEELITLAQRAHPSKKAHLCHLIGNYIWNPDKFELGWPAWRATFMVCANLRAKKKLELEAAHGLVLLGRTPLAPLEQQRLAKKQRTQPPTVI